MHKTYFTFPYFYCNNSGFIRFTALTFATVTIFCSIILADTFLDGDISSYTFDKSKNPYVVSSEILVPEGKSVVIQSGCVLLFKEFTSLTVIGKLEVAGDSESPVIFSSIKDQNFNKASTQPANSFDWNGIRIINGTGNALMRNFQLMYSVYGINCENGQITIDNGVFKQNMRSNIVYKGKIEEIAEDIPVSLSRILQKNDSLPPTVKNKKVSSLDIQTDPAGAEVFINGKKSEILSPVHIDSVVAGKFTIKAQKGILSAQKDITIRENREAQVNLLLEEPKTVVHILTEPAEADIYVNKQITERNFVNFRSPGLVKKIPDTDSLRLAFFKLGFRDTTAIFTFTRHQENTIKISLNPLNDSAALALQKSFMRKRVLARISKYVAGASIPFFITSAYFYNMAEDYNQKAKESKYYLEHTLTRQGTVYEQKLKENHDNASNGKKNNNRSIACGIAGGVLFGVGVTFFVF
jgi:hypothetical protein